MQLPRKNLTVPAGAGIWCQDIGQTLLERVAYDPASGQLLSGSFMDFAMLRADDLPTFTTAFNPVVSDDHAVRGIGEGPTTGAPPAVVNAVLDALSGHGVHAIDMPLTPERVWRRSQDAHSAAVVGMSWHPARS
jgi:carbon-monoxide dehydrogenase large subunit